ncbi:MAG TPA: GntR family transcriptional regulator [Gemmatimonadaceae bacterium]|jgi:DNA-binding GntR family transcriptional regulator
MAAKKAKTTKRRRRTGEPAVAASEVAYVRLVDEIVGGALRPGQRVTEGEIARTLKIGKTPAREALRRLVFDRLVTLQPRNGYKIAPVTLHGVEELCGLRLVVEPAVVAMAAGQLTTQQLAHLRKLAAVGYNATDRPSVGRFLKVNQEFHGIINSACGNQRLAELVNQLHVESYRVFQIQLMHYPDSEDHVLLHQHLVEALSAGDGSKARKLSEREITTSRHFIMNSLMRSPAVRSVAVGD